MKLWRNLQRLFATPTPYLLLACAAASLISHWTSTPGSISGASVLGQDRPAVIQPLPTLREGADIPEWMGTFRLVGERLQFTDRESGRSLLCLENLMLQRVYQVIGDEASESTWIVSGTISEYRGQNFLILLSASRTQ